LIKIKEGADGMEIDNLLVFHCAPTLAGLKIGALICVPREQGVMSYEHMITIYNKCYNRQRLYFRTLCSCKKRQLLYVYRPHKVERYLACPPINTFLQQYGFKKDDTLQQKLDQLATHFEYGGMFPHELGIFLGYPLADVVAFIKYGGSKAKMCGEWKVYTNMRYAQREFEKYDCCRKDYSKRFYGGATLKTLIVA
jgi:hypothetical protein